MKNCLNCDKLFNYKHKIQKFCTYECYILYNKKATINYCCQDCGNLISSPTALVGKGRCRTCSRTGKLSWITSKSGKDSHKWKGGWKNHLPKCIDCGKKLSYNKSKRCVKCNAKIKGLCGTKNPMFGKKPKFYRFNYKNIQMRSSWEILFAVWLDLSDIKWKYEEQTFKVKINNIIKNYTPDFYLPEFDCYIEIKGWWRKDDLLKVNILKKRINLKVFEEKELRKYLGVSRFLLQKSKLTWLNNHRIKQRKGELKC